MAGSGGRTAAGATASGWLHAVHRGADLWCTIDTTASPWLLCAPIPSKAAARRFVDLQYATVCLVRLPRRRGLPPASAVTTAAGPGEGKWGREGGEDGGWYQAIRVSRGLEVEYFTQARVVAGDAAVAPSTPDLHTWLAIMQTASGLKDEVAATRGSGSHGAVPHAPLPSPSSSRPPAPPPPSWHTVADIPPRLAVMRRIQLYATPRRVWLIGQVPTTVATAPSALYRVLEFDRTVPSPKGVDGTGEAARATLPPLSDITREHDSVYTATTINAVISSIYASVGLAAPGALVGGGEAGGGGGSSRDLALGRGAVGPSTASTPSGWSSWWGGGRGGSSATPMGDLTPADALLTLDVVAIIGVVCLTRGYHLAVVTRRGRVGTMGSHPIFTVREMEVIPLFTMAGGGEGSASSGGAMGGEGGDSRGGGGRNTLFGLLASLGVSGVDAGSVLEDRYLSLLLSADLTHNFFFSYTYDCTRTLQQQVRLAVRRHDADTIPAAATTAMVHNATPGPFASPLSRTAHGPDGSGIPAPDTGTPCMEWCWNAHLVATLAAGGVQVWRWCPPIIHGYFSQVTLTTFGSPLVMTLVARRCCAYAGPRYLKRGVNEDGYVANEVETEQIGDNTYGSLSSFVQLRGSVPVYWMQRTNMAMPKPPILLHARDPHYNPARRHFARVMARYGPPVCILNLVKKKEKVGREKVIGREFARAVATINHDLPPHLRLQYLTIDYAALVKSKRFNLLAALRDAGRWVAANTGVFTTGITQRRLASPAWPLAPTASSARAPGVRHAPGTKTGSLAWVGDDEGEDGGRGGWGAPDRPTDSPRTDLSAWLHAATGGARPAMSHHHVHLMPVSRMGCSDQGGTGQSARWCQSCTSSMHPHAPHAPPQEHTVLPYFVALSRMGSVPCVAMVDGDVPHPSSLPGRKGQPCHTPAFTSGIEAAAVRVSLRLSPHTAAPHPPSPSTHVSDSMSRWGWGESDAAAMPASHSSTVPPLSPSTTKNQVPPFMLAGSGGKRGGDGGSASSSVHATSASMWRLFDDGVTTAALHGSNRSDAAAAIVALSRVGGSGGGHDGELVTSRTTTESPPSGALLSGRSPARTPPRAHTPPVLPVDGQSHAQESRPDAASPSSSTPHPPPSDATSGTGVIPTPTAAKPVSPAAVDRLSLFGVSSPAFAAPDGQARVTGALPSVAEGREEQGGEEDGADDGHDGDDDTGSSATGPDGVSKAARLSGGGEEMVDTANPFGPGPRGVVASVPSHSIVGSAPLGALVAPSAMSSMLPSIQEFVADGVATSLVLASGHMHQRSSAAGAEAAGSCPGVVVSTAEQDTTSRLADGGQRVGLAVRLKEYASTAGTSDYLYVNVVGTQHGYHATTQTTTSRHHTNEDGKEKVDGQAGGCEPLQVVPTEWLPPAPARLQVGVVRTNCVDCMDRTNVAQVCIGVHMFGLQLQSLGLQEGDTLDPGGMVVRTLMDMYEDMGDAIALQYGGSEANKKVTSAEHVDSVRAGNALAGASGSGGGTAAGLGGGGGSGTVVGRGGVDDEAAEQSLFEDGRYAGGRGGSSWNPLSWLGGGGATLPGAVRASATTTSSSATRMAGMELLSSLQRFYANSFTDGIKQDGMNVLLGVFQPLVHAPPQVWELETDAYLHNASLAPMLPPALARRLVASWLPTPWRMATGGEWAATALRAFHAGQPPLPTTRSQPALLDAAPLAPLPTASRPPSGLATTRAVFGGTLDSTLSLSAMMEGGKLVAFDEWLTKPYFKPHQAAVPVPVPVPLATTRPGGHLRPTLPAAPALGMVMPPLPPATAATGAAMGKVVTAPHASGGAVPAPWWLNGGGSGLAGNHPASTRRAGTAPLTKGGSTHGDKDDGEDEGDEGGSGSGSGSGHGDGEWDGEWQEDDEDPTAATLFGDVLLPRRRVVHGVATGVHGTVPAGVALNGRGSCGGVDAMLPPTPTHQMESGSHPPALSPSSGALDGSGVEVAAAVAMSGGSTPPPPTMSQPPLLLPPWMRNNPNVLIGGNGSVRMMSVEEGKMVHWRPGRGAPTPTGRSHGHAHSAAAQPSPSRQSNRMAARRMDEPGHMATTSQASNLSGRGSAASGGVTRVDEWELESVAPLSITKAQRRRTRGATHATIPLPPNHAPDPTPPATTASALPTAFGDPFPYHGPLTTASSGAGTVGRPWGAHLAAGTDAWDLISPDLALYAKYAAMARPAGLVTGATDAGGLFPAAPTHPVPPGGGSMSEAKLRIITSADQVDLFRRSVLAHTCSGDDMAACTAWQAAHAIAGTVSYAGAPALPRTALAIVLLKDVANVAQVVEATATAAGVAPIPASLAHVPANCAQAAPSAMDALLFGPGVSHLAQQCGMQSAGSHPGGNGMPMTGSHHGYHASNARSSASTASMPSPMVGRVGGGGSGGHDG